MGCGKRGGKGLRRNYETSAISVICAQSLLSVISVDGLCYLWMVSVICYLWMVSVIFYLAVYGRSTYQRMVSK